MTSPKNTIEIQDANFEVFEIPAKRELCPVCDGDRVSSDYLGAFSSEEMAEDPEFASAYFAGDYDRKCKTCNGFGYVLEADRERLTLGQLRALEEHEIREEQELQMVAAERRMGA